MTADAARIKGFDGLRAIAILLVFFSHKLDISQGLGRAGVWLFFVLSGFLIVRILARSRARIEDGQQDAAGALIDFFRRRTARIFPIYYLVLALASLAGLFVTIEAFAPGRAIYFWLYGVNFLQAAHADWIPEFGHFWSLAVEEQFYLLAAPLLLLLPRRYALPACCTLIAIGLAAKARLHAAGASDITLYVDALSNFALLAYGGVIGLLADRPLPARLSSGAAQAGVLAAYIGIVTFVADPLLGEIGVLLVGVLLVQIYQNQQSWFARMLDGAPFRPIGLISYGFYVLHPFVVLPMIDNGVLRLSAEFGGTLGLAALSFRYFESPIMRWAATRRIRARAA